jgi:hypothetical protein
MSIFCETKRGRATRTRDLTENPPERWKILLVDWLKLDGIQRNGQKSFLNNGFSSPHRIVWRHSWGAASSFHNSKHHALI